MTDVFISYSRRDKVFTQKLVDALQAADREVWADWASIPAASDWDAEIKAGIENTNTVLFVLSPEWIKSNECRKEMDHAVKMGKRLVPILHIMPAEGQAVPPELAKLNWVYMREGDDFDKAFQTLQDAMDTDLDWIKTHTRIQVRALEWDKKNRSASFALRGEDLTEGEQFIASGANKSPAPTQLQSEYILASRKDATRRQRQTLAGVTVALVVSIALGIAAFIQRKAAVASATEAANQAATAVVAQNTAVAAESTAVSAKETAVRQAQIALARQLASQAQLLSANSSSQDITAVLLSIQSLNMFPNTEARNFLINNTISRLPQNSLVSSVAFSSDGTYVVSGGWTDGTVHVWQTSNGAEVVDMSHNTTGVISVDFSPDGKYVVSGGHKTARVWEVATGKEVAHMTLEGGVSSVDFSPDGKYIVLGGCDEVDLDLNCIQGTSRVWEPVTDKEVAHMSYEGKITEVAFSPDSKYVVSGGYDKTARVWEVATGKEVAHVTHDDWVSAVAFSPDGKHIVSGGYDNTIRIWEVVTGKETARIRYDSFLFSIAFSPDGKYVASGGYDSTVRVWEVATGKEVARMTQDGPVPSLAFSPDGQYVMSSGSYDNTVHIWSWKVDDLIAQSCATVPRNLTREEWAQYIGDAMPYQAVCPNLPIEPEVTATPSP